MTWMWFLPRELADQVESLIFSSQRPYRRTPDSGRGKHHRLYTALLLHQPFPPTLQFQGEL